VRWTLWSLVSGLGETVAALAAHMELALQAAASKVGSASWAWARSWALFPVKPMLRRKVRSGRCCGGRMACFRPRSMRVFILARPWRAAALGLEVPPALESEAMFPAESPA